MPPALPAFLSSAEDPPAKRAILACALRRFVVDGLDGTSIRTVAADAGFTNPALFRHFAGKEELAAHLFAVCYRRLAGFVAVPSVARLTVMSRVASATASDCRATVNSWA